VRCAFGLVFCRGEAEQRLFGKLPTCRKAGGFYATFLLVFPFTHG
jgi:hypothetical protein